MTASVKRAYDSSRRRDQARRNRRRVVEAATTLFVERGYAATSIAAIAEAAGVAPQTVYASFGSKAAILGEAVGVALAGDDEPIAVYDRPEAQAVLQADEPGAAARAFARSATAILERAGGILHAADGAADQDPELQPMRVEGHKLRLVDMRRVTKALGASGLLRPGVSAELAADLLWAMASPDVYRSFLVVRGWNPRRYERWLTEVLERTVLVDPGQPG